MERNLSKNAFINALALLGGGAALIVLARYENSATAAVAAAFFASAFVRDGFADAFAGFAVTACASGISLAIILHRFASSAWLPLPLW